MKFERHMLERPSIGSRSSPNLKRGCCSNAASSVMLLGDHNNWLMVFGHVGTQKETLDEFLADSRGEVAECDKQHTGDQDHLG